MRMQIPGARKYAHTSSLISSSKDLGWSSITAELRAHGAGEASAIIPLHVEVCLVVEGNEDSLAVRRVAGNYSEAVPRTGTIWLGSAGISKEVAITASIPRTGHFYLPMAIFERLKEDFGLSGDVAHSIRSEAGFRDDVIDQLGRSILAELKSESAASRIYVETASLALTARLVQRYSDGGMPLPLETSVHYLDTARLRRVLDYIDANIRSDITLASLAGIAGYSAFHFARKFTLTMGIAPHGYISQVRLKLAMAELRAKKLSLAEIAFNAQFSSQSSFTRAFHRAAGMTPKEYQRRHS